MITIIEIGERLGLDYEDCPDTMLCNDNTYNNEDDIDVYNVSTTISKTFTSTVDSIIEEVTKK